MNYGFFAPIPHTKEIAMNDANESKPMTGTALDASRQWVAPEFTVLNTGATAGGANVNTEAFSYHPS